MSYDPELPNGFQDADFEMRDLEERAREIDYARKRGFCLACDLTSAPGTIRVWHPTTGGHTTREHDGCGPINEIGLCAACDAEERQ